MYGCHTFRSCRLGFQFLAVGLQVVLVGQTLAKTSQRIRHHLNPKKKRNTPPSRHVYARQCCGSMLASISDPDLVPDLDRIQGYESKNLEILQLGIYFTLKTVMQLQGGSSYRIEETFSPQKRTFSASKHEISSLFLFLRVISPTWIRIGIHKLMAGVKF
jgi:hypothetical protein